MNARKAKHLLRVRGKRPAKPLFGTVLKLRQRRCCFKKIPFSQIGYGPRFGRENPLAMLRAITSTMTRTHKVSKSAEEKTCA